MEQVSLYSLAALVAYVAVLAGITYAAARKESASDFMIASKDVGWQATGLSLFATLISSYNLVLGITFAYLFGVYFLFASLGLVFAYIVIYYLFQKIRASSLERRFITIVDYFAYAFGKEVGNVVHWIILFVLFFFITLQINVNSFVFSQIMGWSTTVAALVVTGIVLAYSLTGGFKVVIRTDIFQGVLMFIILGLAVFVGTSGITAENISANIFNKALFISAIALFVLQFLSLLVQPELWQRVYAARSMRDLKWGFALSAVLLAVLLGAETLIGMAARGGTLITNPGNAFYDVLQFSAPEWFFPFVAVSLFAAFMSTLDSSLFAISSQLAKSGFLVAYRDELKEGPMKIKTRVWMVGVLVVALILSLFLADFLTAMFQLVSIAVVISTAFLVSLILKTSSRELLIGLIVGIIAFVYATFSGLITQEIVTALYPSGILVAYMVLQRIAVWGWWRMRVQIA